VIIRLIVDWLAALFLLNACRHRFIDKIILYFRNFYALYKFRFVVYSAVFQILTFSEEAIGGKPSR
jgi:hypothetical protein